MQPSLGLVMNATALGWAQLATAGRTLQERNNTTTARRTARPSEHLEGMVARERFAEVLPELDEQRAPPPSRLVPGEEERTTCASSSKPAEQSNQLPAKPTRSVLSFSVRVVLVVFQSDDLVNVL